MSVKVAVIGAGRMGVAIGGELARRGAEVAFFDRTDFNRVRAMAALHAYLESHRSEQLLTANDVLSIESRVRVGATLSDALEGATIVVEAIYEDLQAKRALMAEVDADPSLPLDAVITSTSMNFSISAITDGLSRRVSGLRFLHPVMFIDEVEIMNDVARSDGFAEVDRLTKRLNFRPFEGVAGQGRKRLSDAEVQAAWSAQRRLVASSEPGAVPATLTAVGGEMQAQMAAQEAEPCVICMEMVADMAIFLPCGHKDTCFACAKLLEGRSAQATCPTCRVTIEKVLHAGTT